MYTSRTVALLIGDTLCFLLALGVMISVESGQTPSLSTMRFYAAVFFVPLFLALMSSYLADLYEVGRMVPSPQSVGAFVLASALSGVFIALYFYLFPGSGITPKTNLVILAFTFLVFLLGWRQLFKTLFAGSIGWRVCFVGEHHEVGRLKEAFARHPHIGRVVGSVESIEHCLKQPLVADLLILAQESDAPAVERAAEITLPVITARRAFEEIFGRTPLSLFTPTEALALLEHREHGIGKFLWRVCEFLVASIILVVALPFLLVAALAIWLEDRGNFLYRQERVGYKKKKFFLYKLRTMRRDAEASGAQWAELRDGRITRVGRVLRKIHLDEVPQMINVIKGELALVGPRPEQSPFVEKLEQEIPFYFLRHRVKPGFTGWAQIKYRYARNIEESKEKFEYDLYYLRHRSLLLNIGILIKTAQIIFTH